MKQTIRINSQTNPHETKADHIGGMKCFAKNKYTDQQLDGRRKILNETKG